MTTSIFHGIKTNLLATGTRAINPVATSVIGMVCTASDADVGAFPLDRPVLITDVRDAIGKAGVLGTLSKALAAIADQCSPTIIVVRVATVTGGGPPTQDTMVIGTNVSGVYTGMQALLAAEAVTGVRPRILGAPGLATAAVTAAFVPIAQALRGMVYALAVGTTVAEVDTYAATYGQRAVELLWPETSVGGGDCEARALGLRSAIDQSTGWQKSLSNVVVNNITGLAKDVSWTLNGSSSDAATLNNANVTTLINRNGFRFWGNRTCSSLPQYAFETATRTSQALADTIEQGLFWAGDQPMTAGLVKDILATINAAFRQLVATGKLIGANAWFDPSLNPADQLANGQLQIDYDFTPVAPLEGLTENQRITDRYYADFSTQLTVTG